MRYLPYPAYKPSGSPWLGDIPLEWNTHRLKWSVTGCDNGVWGDEPDGGEDDIVCLRVADFDRNSLRVGTDTLTVRSVDARQRSSRKLNKDDLLLEKSGGGEKQLVGCVVHFDHEFDAVCSNFVARMAVATGQYSRFWAYAHAALYAGKVNYLAIKQTTGIQNLDSAEYLNLRVAYPPEAEQEQIAAFLDWKTGQIDVLIAKKQALIDKLKEKRLAVITQAVTKGLDVSVRLRDSGVPWLGFLPNHWEVIPLGFLIWILGGMTPSLANSAYWEGDIPWVSPKDMKQSRISDSIDHITEQALAETSISLIPVSSVLVVVRGMILAHSFPAAITECPVTINQDMKALQCADKLEVEYLLWCLTGFAKVLVSLAQESAHGTRKIETDTLKKLPFPVPPISEQREICAQIAAQLNQLDRLADTTEKTLARLTEYRTALITAATTGQIDVRNVEIPVQA